MNTQEWDQIGPRAGAIFFTSARLGESRAQHGMDPLDASLDFLGPFIAGLAVAVYDPEWAGLAWREWQQFASDAEGNSICDSLALMGLAENLKKTAARWPNVPMPAWTCVQEAEDALPHHEPSPDDC